jgi:2-polyprenyl-6-hydroxyphenyl methylase/3-demethylubiquinone-9 3-methyltransferase
MATAAVNNEIYRSLGERWYEAQADPVALLRAEARLHAPWIARTARARLGKRALQVLDLGCGGGFIANDLARRDARFHVLGVDRAREALDVAADHDTTGRVRWLAADARALPLASGTFDVVCAMDFLEHVEPVSAVIAEVSRLLRPGGLFFFHTFDRSWLAWLVVIQGVSLFVHNAPKDLHVYQAFIRPHELVAACRAKGLRVGEEQLRGSAPTPLAALLRLAMTGVVPRELEFRFTRTTSLGYSGVAEKVTGPIQSRG